MRVGANIGVAKPCHIPGTIPNLYLPINGPNNFCLALRCDSISYGVEHPTINIIQVGAELSPRDASVTAVAAPNPGTRTKSGL